VVGGRSLALPDQRAEGFFLPLLDLEIFDPGGEAPPEGRAVPFAEIIRFKAESRALMSLLMPR